MRRSGSGGENKRMSSNPESQNAANKFSKANLAYLRVTDQPSTKKFRTAGQPAGITSTNVKMLGENIYSSQTTTDPFSSVPQFSPTKVHKLDHDDRSTCTSISDTDDSYSSHSQAKGDDKVSVKPPEKKTRGRVKIKMEYINNKLRRYTTFSKRKSGIMKKAYELSTLTGTQVMLLVASETGHVYTFATPKLQPMITSEAGKALIQTCLHQPDQTMSVVPVTDYDNRMSANGFEETDLGYHMPDDDYKGNMPDPCLIPVTTSAGVHVMPTNSLPHGMIPMQGFATMPPEMSIMTHGQMVLQQSTQAMSPPHSSPPPSYSPPGQPSSPHRANTYVTVANSYPSSPPSATYSGPTSHMTAAHHQQVMMEEMGYEQRSPSHSPIGHQQHRYSHSPQGMYPTSSASPSTMARM